MLRRQPLPLLWLLSDARTDARLETAIARLPEGSGFVFRHYHLGEAARAERLAALLPLLQAHAALVAVARSPELALRSGVPAYYGAAPHPGLAWLASAHDGVGIDAAERAGAAAVFLSPVFPTASHSGGATLGPSGFHSLAQRARVPIIALGGMTAARAQELGWPRWGAIDGLA